MEHFFAFLFLLAFFILVFLFFVHVSNFFVSMVGVIQQKNSIKLAEKIKNKNKLLNSISTIHSTNNCNALNNALQDFRKSIEYHKVNDIKFLDKDLVKLNVAVEKFTTYKSFKLYGLDQQKSALREYRSYLQQSRL